MFILFTRIFKKQPDTLTKNPTNKALLCDIEMCPNSDQQSNEIVQYGLSTLPRNDVKQERVYKVIFRHLH
jgi:hypothetical protein